MRWWWWGGQVGWGGCGAECHVAPLTPHPTFHPPPACSYWTLWKLPMFGCTDGSQVLEEIEACRQAFPDAYSR